MWITPISEKQIYIYIWMNILLPGEFGIWNWHFWLHSVMASFKNHFIYIPNVVPPFLVPPVPDFLTQFPLPFSSERVPPSSEASSLYRIRCVLSHWGQTRQSVLCYICARGHRPAHVCSLVGGLVSGSSEEPGLVDTLGLLWGCHPLQLLHSFP